MELKLSKTNMDDKHLDISDSSKTEVYFENLIYIPL